MVAGFGPRIRKEYKDFRERIVWQRLEQIADIAVVERKVFKVPIMHAAHGLCDAVHKGLCPDEMNAAMVLGLPK